MLKPIHRVACSPALAACQLLMQRFALWLCNPDTTAASLTQQGLQPPVLSSSIEADWLWDFLQREVVKTPLLDRATLLVTMPEAQKAALATWVGAVSVLISQFQAGPAAWPIACPLADKAHWTAFKTLMEAFYEKGFRTGLPYLADGTPTATGGVNYASFVSSFRTLHLLNSDPNARQVCVFCGGPLGDTPHVDHWVFKGAYPLLSVCKDNLTLICDTCNKAPNKGEKAVHRNGSFTDWFHPYLRPGAGAITLTYHLPEFSVKCTSATLVDSPKADNLNSLLNLSARWTREFKSEYAKHKKILLRQEQRRIQNAQARHTQADILAYIEKWQEDLVANEPHHEVHQELAAALQEPSRLAAWHAELNA